MHCGICEMGLLCTDFLMSSLVVVRKLLLFDILQKELFVINPRNGVMQNVDNGGREYHLEWRNFESWCSFGPHHYASAFRRRRHYVFGLSVRPSVRSLKYPLLTCTWVCWSTRPTVTVLRHVRPSVHPSREVSGHLPENAWRDWPEILHADVSWPSSELISLWPWSVEFSNFGTTLT